ncbi:MAG: hypothetical protein WAW86_06860 [Gammaproteobacteria bacterium]
MPAFKVSNNKQSMVITFGEAPFELLFSQVPREEILNLESIARDVAYSVFTENAFRGSLPPKRMHIAFYHSPENGISLCYRCTHVSNNHVIPGVFAFMSLEASPQKAGLTVEKATLLVSDDDRLIDVDYKKFAVDTKSKQGEFVLRAPTSQLMPLMAKPVIYPALVGVTEQSEAYQDQFTSFKMQPAMPDSALSFADFRQYEAKVAGIEAKLKQLDGLRKAFDQIKFAAVAADRLPGFLQDLETLEIKSKFISKSSDDSNLFEEFFEKLLIAYGERYHDLKALKSPEQDLKSVFFDTETLHQAKRFVKVSLFAALYNFAVLCFNDILDSEPATRIEKRNLFNRIFAELGIEIDRDRNEIRSFQEAKSLFLRITNNDFTQIALAVQTLLSNIKAEENKKQSMLGAATTWTLQKAWGGSADSIPTIASLTSEKISKELDHVKAHIDREIKALFLDQLNSPVLYARFYNESVAAASSSNQPAYSVFSYARQYNLGVTKARLASDAKFVWHTQDNDLVVRHDYLKGILSKYSEEDKDFDTFKAIDDSLSAFIDDARDTYLAYWQQRLALYDDLKQIKDESAVIAEELDREARVYEKHLTLESVTWTSPATDIKATLQLPKDNAMAGDAVDALRLKLKSLQQTRDKVAQLTKSILSKLSRIANHQVDANIFADRLANWVVELKQKKKKLIDAQSLSGLEESAEIAPLIVTALDYINNLLTAINGVERTTLSEFFNLLTTATPSQEVIVRSKYEELDKAIDKFESDIGKVPRIMEISKVVLFAECPYQIGLCRLKNYLHQSENENLQVAFNDIMPTLAMFSEGNLEKGRELFAIEKFREIRNYLGAVPFNTGFAVFSFAQQFFPFGDGIEALTSDQVNAQDGYILDLLKKTRESNYPELISYIKQQLIPETFNITSGKFFKTMPAHADEIKKVIEAATKYDVGTFGAIREIALKACNEGNKTGSRTKETQAFYFALAGGVLPTVRWMSNLKKAAMASNVATSSLSPK